MKLLIVTYCTLAAIMLFGLSLRQEINQEKERMARLNRQKPVLKLIKPNTMKKAA